VKAVSETRNLAFVVQSSIAQAEKLTDCIILFLDNAKSYYLDPLSDAQLSLYVKGLILKRTEPDKKLATEATRNWNEIATGRLTFDRLQREVRALLDVTKADIIRFWDNFYVGENGGRRILVTEISPHSGSAASPKPQRKTGYSYTESENSVPIILGIDDIEIFRSRAQ
jgi:insulysin